MASYNRVILVGNVTRAPEVRYIQSGTALCDVGLAVNDRRKGSNGELVEDTTFVDVTCWGKTAETAGQYLAKGNPVMVEGRLKLESWEDKGGQKRSKLKVVCERLVLLPSNRGSTRAGRADDDREPGPVGTARRGGQVAPAPITSAEGIPF
ncbi:MAG: single-stranded DNA-binding protein [Pirellulales bacterium]|nr:single-stranded DNA-binding protein [Pirellulales bacterium]